MWTESFLVFAVQVRVMSSDPKVFYDNTNSERLNCYTRRFDLVISQNPERLSLFDLSQNPKELRILQQKRRVFKTLCLNIFQGEHDTIKMSNNSNVKPETNKRRMTIIKFGVLKFSRLQSTVKLSFTTVNIVYMLLSYRHSTNHIKVCR